MGSEEIKNWTQALPKTEQKKVEALSKIMGGLKMADETQEYWKTEVFKNHQWKDTRGRSFRWVVYTEGGNIYSFFHPSNLKSDTMIRDLDPGDEAKFIYTESVRDDKVYYNLSRIEELVKTEVPPEQAKPAPKPAPEPKPAAKPSPSPKPTQSIFDPQARKAAAERADSMVRKDAIDLSGYDVDTRIAYIHALTLAWEKYFTGVELDLPLPDSVDDEVKGTLAVGDTATDDFPPEEE